MHLSKSANSSLVDRYPNHSARCGHRSGIVAGLTLLLLIPFVWFYQPYNIFRTPISITQGNSGESNFVWGKHSVTVGSPIPPKIWQLFLPKTLNDLAISPDRLDNTGSWLALNPDYTYTLVGHKRGTDFIQHHFGDDVNLMDVYNQIPNVGMKSDILRHLILSIEGGVYTDTDTVALKPIDAWVPKVYRDQVRLVVSVKSNQRDNSAQADMSHEVQFCLWTIAAAPGHPVMRTMVTRAIESLHDLAAKHKVPIRELKPSSREVMNSTGIATWTEVVFEQLQKADPSLQKLADLSAMTEPRLIGDILVLPVEAFDMGQQSSDDMRHGAAPDGALLKHHARGSWRGNMTPTGHGMERGLTPRAYTA